MEIVLLLSIAFILAGITAYMDNLELFGNIMIGLAMVCILSFNIWFFSTEVQQYRVPLITGFVGDRPLIQVYEDPQTRDTLVVKLDKKGIGRSYVECRIPRPLSIQSKVCAVLESHYILDYTSELKSGDFSNSITPVVINWYKVLERK